MSSRTALFVAVFAVLATVLAFPRWAHQATEAPIAWDVSGYYLYLPATLIHGDLKKLGFLPGIIEKYGPTPTPEQAYPIGNGNLVMKYPVGMAVLYLPFFLVAHVLAGPLGFPADGFSLPYQVAVQLGGALVALLGLFFLRKILRRYFPDRTVGWALLLTALGTNFFNYATFDSGNVHVWSFALLALLTHLTIRWHERPSWPAALGIGASVGLAALVRPTEALFAIVPLCWGVTGLAGLRSKFLLCKKHLPMLLAAAALTAAIGFTQLAYWKWVAGEWLVYSYQDQGFSFLRPHFTDVFFSYRKGWFVYSPLMLFALLGFWRLVVVSRKSWVVSREPSAVHQYPASSIQYPLTAILLFCFANTWVVASWDIWWYGGAFGQRALIASYVLLAFPLAALMGWAFYRKWASWLLAPLLAGCTLLNLFQTYQAHWGPWEALDMNRAYYWHIFANTHDDPYAKLLLDTNETFHGEKKEGKTVFTANFQSPADTVGLSRALTHDSPWSLAVDAKTEFSQTLTIPRTAEMAAGKWLTVNAHYAQGEQVPSFWHMPQVVLRFMKGDEMVADRFFRPGRILPNLNEWRPLSVDMRLPAKDFDRVLLFLWRPQPMGSLYADGTEVEIQIQGSTTNSKEPD